MGILRFLRRLELDGRRRCLSSNAILPDGDVDLPDGDVDGLVTCCLLSRRFMDCSSRCPRRTMSTC